MKALAFTRRIGAPSAGALLLALLALATGAAMAEPGGAAGQELGPPITNVWVDVPLSQVLRDISVETGAVIALDPSVPDQLVSLQVEQEPLEQCLRKLTAAQGLAVRRLEHGFYVVGSGKPDSLSFDRVAEVRRVYLNYITERHLRSSLPRSLEAYVASGERKTEVLVVAPREKMETILDIVQLLDVPAPQIVLEALVVELSQEAGGQLGVDWERAGKDTVVSIAETTGAFTGVIRHTSIDERAFSTLLVTLRMLLQRGEACVRSRPRVATLNGEQAAIEVSLEEYFNIVTDINGAFLRTELQVVKSGVVLKMTPQIGQDGDITVNVSTEVSDVATRRSNVRGSNGNSDTLPVIRRRKADTRVRVKEGDAIVIGGLIESQERNEEKRVPILGSIPLLGVLFRSTTAVTVEKEVIIFITPRVMTAEEAPLSDRHELIDPSRELATVRSDTRAAAPKR